MTSRIGTKERGFTLLELLIVTSLLAVIMGLAAPSLRSSFRHLQLEHVSRGMVSLMRFAQENAVAQGAFLRLNFDAEEGKYWLTFSKNPPVVGQEDFQLLSSSMGRVRSLPMGISFDDVRDVAGSSIFFITFYPSGRVDAATIYISNADGSQMALKTEGRLATPQVEEVSTS